MRLIDLRSDTVTRPSEGMRRAMANAEVGDDVYGEDPTVRKLEEKSAELLGLEASLFVASGALENTHGRSGGSVIPLAEFKPLAHAAKKHGLLVHLDGARLCNAEVATGTRVREWASLCDSATLCFSKGLGAPVGSVVAGSKDF